MRRVALVAAAILAGALSSTVIGCGSDCGPDLLPLDPGTYVPVNANEAPSGYRLVMASDHTFVETFTTDGHQYEIHYQGGQPF